MSSPSLPDITQRLATPEASVITEGLAATKAGVSALHHHPDIAVQRAAADAMLLVLIARDAILPFVFDLPEPDLQRLADNDLRDEVVRLLRALSAALLSADLHPGAIDAVAAGRASLYLDDAADTLGG